VMLSENHPLDVLDNAVDLRRESFLHRDSYPYSFEFAAATPEYQGFLQNNVGRP
jgi:hypothetical protein